MFFIKHGQKEWQTKTGYSKKVFLDDKDLRCPGTRVQEILIKPVGVAKEHYHKKQTLNHVL